MRLFLLPWSNPPMPKPFANTVSFPESTSMRPVLAPWSINFSIVDITNLWFACNKMLLFSAESNSRKFLLSSMSVSNATETSSEAFPTKELVFKLSSLCCILWGDITSMFAEATSAEESARLERLEQEGDAESVEEERDSPCCWMRRRRFRPLCKRPPVPSLQPSSAPPSLFSCRYGFPNITRCCLLLSGSSACRELQQNSDRTAISLFSSTAHLLEKKT